MKNYMTIVLEVEDMVKFDVNFKDEIHGGKVVSMAKFDAINYVDVTEKVLGESDWLECVEALEEIKEKTGT